MYEPNFMGRSPSMHSSSSNALAYVPEKLSYLGKEVVVGGDGGKGNGQGNGQGKGGRRGRRRGTKYDARGLSYDRMKMEAAAKRRRERKKMEKGGSSESSESSESDVSFSSSTSSSSSLPTLLTKNSPTPTSLIIKELTYHEKKRRPRNKSRHGLEEQEWCVLVLKILF